MRDERLTLTETFGLTEPRTRLARAKMAILGDQYTPPSRWGVSSLKIYRPVLSVKTWLGWRPEDRLVPVTNYFNRTPTPISEGWSVRKTQVRDFRGGTATYDSHNGTDFGIPPGVFVTSPAPGVVRRVSNEFHRGGLKIVIDHGLGLITTSGHLARALVNEGDLVDAGQRIALSGYSGIDSVVAFPWSVPHVHFNTWLNGVPIDPFATPEEESIWIHRNAPRPYEDGIDVGRLVATEWDEDALRALIDSCQDPEMRRELSRTEEVDKRAVDTIFLKNYFPTRFTQHISPYAQTFERQPRMVLLFDKTEYDGVRLLS